MQRSSFLVSRKRHSMSTVYVFRSRVSQKSFSSSPPRPKKSKERVAGVARPRHTGNTLFNNLGGGFAANQSDVCEALSPGAGHVERRPVTLSAAKGLARRAQRSFAALRMTARTPRKSCHPEPMRYAQGKLREGPLTGRLLSTCPAWCCF